MADLLTTAGADRIMTVDLHTAQLQGFLDGPVDHLLAQRLLADHVRRYRNGLKRVQIAAASPEMSLSMIAERVEESRT